jgi:hypothetical protein
MRWQGRCGEISDGRGFAGDAGMEGKHGFPFQRESDGADLSARDTSSANGSMET